MKTGFFIQESGTSNYLRDSVELLINRIAHPTYNKKSFILNDISEDIIIDTDENLLSSVLNNLLTEVIGHTENGCIRITAKTFNDIVLLHVKNDGALNYDLMLNKLTDIHSLAEKLGGYIGFTSFRNKVTTIAFSFTNMKSKAA